MEPIIQIALDFTDKNKAEKVARAALSVGADWLEIGNPLVKFEGIHGIRYICTQFPNAYVLVDYMVLAGAPRYVQAAKEHGVKNLTVTALAPDYTVKNTINEGKEKGVAITVDLFNVPDMVEAAQKYADMGADYIMVHFGTDQKKNNPKGSPFDQLKAIKALIDTPLSYAVYDQAEAIEAVACGASIIVVGSPLINAENPEETIAKFVQNVKKAGMKS